MDRTPAVGDQKAGVTDIVSSIIRTEPCNLVQDPLRIGTGKRNDDYPVVRAGRKMDRMIEILVGCQKKCLSFTGQCENGRIRQPLLTGTPDIMDNMTGILKKTDREGRDILINKKGHYQSTGTVSKHANSLLKESAALMSSCCSPG